MFKKTLTAQYNQKPEKFQMTVGLTLPSLRLLANRESSPDFFFYPYTCVWHAANTYKSVEIKNSI